MIYWINILSDFSFINVPTFWVVIGIVFLLALFSGHYLEGQRNAEEDLKEKAKQVKELEEINKEFQQKNRELYAKELELTMANRRLQTLEETKSKFISVTTHQLRTPLAAIKWTFDMMAKGQLGEVNEEQTKFLNNGLISTNRVITIVNELLRVDKMDTGQDNFNFKKTDLIQLIKGVLLELTNQAEIKKVTLNLAFPTNGLPEIEIDENRIRIVLENLIDNSIKYSPENGIVDIQISDDGLNSGEGSVKVSIQDSGIGIPKEESDRIFEKFFRASNAVQKEPDGSGLGLFISRDIIQKHNGTMWFERLDDGGTKFCFTLPLHQKKV